MPERLWYKKGPELLDEIDATSVPTGGLALWFLGQESLVVKSGETVIYIDPYFTELFDQQGNPRRKFSPPFGPDEVRNAAWVFCTHHHLDHLDPGTLAPISISSPQARFVVPAPHVRLVQEIAIATERITPARAGERLSFGGWSVMPIAAAHEQFETDERGNHLFLGYVFDFGGLRFYHAGDTVEYPELVDTLKPHRIHVGCLPINGADWRRRRRDILGNLNAREAVDVAVAAGFDVLVPLHYDLFIGNQANPAHLVDYLYEHYPAQKFHILAPGERWIYVP